MTVIFHSPRIFEWDDLSAQLEEAMYLGKIGEQIVLKSEKSYRQIRFLDYEPVDASIWYQKRKTGSVRKAAIFSSGSGRMAKGALYMPRILDEEIGPDDTRIQRIVYENAQKVFGHMLHYVVYDLGMKYDPLQTVCPVWSGRPVRERKSAFCSGYVRDRTGG